MANGEQVIYVNMNTENVKNAIEELDKELLVLRLAFGKLKAAITRAVAPIGAVFVPALQKAVWAATRLVKAVGKVIGALLGYDTAARNTAKAQTALAEANKEVKKSLAGFDQIDQLDTADSEQVAEIETPRVNDTLSPQLQAVVDKIRSLLEPLNAIDFAPLTAAFGRLKEAIVPISQALFAGLEWAWHNLLVPLAGWTIENLLPAFLHTLAAALGLVNEVIVALKPAADWLWESFLQPIAQWTGGQLIAALGWLRERLDSISAWVSENRGLVQGVVQVAATIWDGIKAVWSSAAGWFRTHLFAPLADGAKDAVNGIIGFLNGIVSGVVSAVNSVVQAINKLQMTLPDWIPGLGGKSIGFNLKTASAPQIPYLAKGAVLPANQPFLAVVGDQKYGTNVEAPLDVIKQAVAEVLGDRQDTMVRVNFTGNLAQLARVLKPEIEIENRRRGVSLAKGAIL